MAELSYWWYRIYDVYILYLRFQLRSHAKYNLLPFYAAVVLNNLNMTHASPLATAPSLAGGQAS
jgi:hypothetical protein